MSTFRLFDFWTLGTLLLDFGTWDFGIFNSFEFLTLGLLDFGTLGLLDFWTLGLWDLGIWDLVIFDNSESQGQLFDN